MTLALIDADILVYEAAYRAQSSVEWEPGEWSHGASMPEAMKDFELRIEKIIEAIGATRHILVLTSSDRANNFRRALWAGYKNQRETKGGQRPLLYKALRQWAQEEFPSKLKEGIEGDDSLGIMATGPIKGFPPLEKRVICSIDKDMLTISGWHYNWRKDDLGVVYVSENEANYNHMMQTLTGDSTDGYPGLPGMGPVRAKRILDEAPFPADRWLAVVAAYEDKGLTEKDALIQARCARILQACDWDFDNEQVVLWTPPEA